jgi:hypothetical protein
MIQLPSGFKFVTAGSADGERTKLIGMLSDRISADP